MKIGQRSEAYMMAANTSNNATKIQVVLQTREVMGDDEYNRLCFRTAAAMVMTTLLVNLLPPTRQPENPRR